jgi:predicted dienelactone hydrolase
MGHNSPVRIGRILATAVVVLAVVAGFLTYARAQSQRAVSLAPSGQYPVGRLTDLWVDRSRTDQFAPVGGTPRMLSTWVWYPAAAGAHGPESAYAPGEWAGLQRFGWAATGLDRVRTGTRDDVTWARGRFPVVVLLPDLGLSAPQYAAVASGLAARGNVVVGVTPTYSSRLSVIDGRPVAASAAGSSSGREDQLVSVWAADARFASGRAAQQFGARVDNSRIAYVGHGLGGTAAIEACRLDGRCAAAVSLDGSPAGAAATDGFSRPLLLLNAGRSPSSAGRSFTVTGADRLSFTDLAAFRVAAPLRWALPLGSVDGRRALAITVDYAGSFLHSAVTGDTWKAPAYPEVHEATVLSR